LKAENIDFHLGKYLPTADNNIFNQFHLNNYSTSNPTIITDADKLITNHFYSENN